MEKKHQPIEELIWRYFEKSASTDELKQIAEWLDASKANLQRFTTMKKIFVEMETRTTSSDEQNEKAFNRFLTSIERIETNRKIEKSQGILYMRKRFYRYAGLILLSVILGISSFYVLDFLKPVKKNAFFEVAVPKGGRSSLVLPDGSKIWLNADSKIRYNQDFGKKSREVFIEGEAYFDVEKSKHPFVVHTSHFDIHVMGTEFNVKAYKEEKNIETTLVEGNIKIEGKESPGTLYLKPKQKLIYNKSGSYRTEPSEKAKIETSEQAPLPAPEKAVALIPSEKIAIVSNVDIRETTLWKEGELYFNNETLADLVKMLERKYDVKIEFADVKIKSYTYTGTLPDLPLEQVLKALEISTPPDQRPIRYSVEGKKVKLRFLN